MYKYLGNAHDALQMSLVMILSLAIVSVYFWTAPFFLPPDALPGLFDTLGTVTALACVILTRYENIWCWPLGILSVVFMGIFFIDIQLMGQAGLHILYYLPIQFYGWYQWLYAGAGLNNLPITKLSNQHRLYGLLIIAASTIGIAQVIDLFAYSQYIYWDASIVASSIVAQTLLTRKKVEAWWLWLVPVNVSAIGLYAVTGAWMFAALYVVFLINAVFAVKQWHKKAI